MSLILAQNKRLKNASHMQVERLVVHSIKRRERVSNA